VRPPLRRARKKCEHLAEAVRQLEVLVADLDDTLVDQLVEQLKRPVIQIDRRLNVLDEEQAVRGLGDPAVTGKSDTHHEEHHARERKVPAPGGPTEPFAGEPVGRGRPTKGRR
jgi:hypothetical protein